MGRLRAALGAAGFLLAAGCGGREPGSGGSAATEAERAAAVAFRAAQAAEAEALGVPASFANDLGMRFELVPAGHFMMGSAPTDPARGADEAQHEVRIVLAYYVGATEVPASAIAAWRGAPPPADPAAPATGLSEDDAAAFAAWLSDRDPAYAYRLPTEGEWEQAARDAGAGGPAAAVAGTSSGPWEWCADLYGPYPDWYVANPAGPDRGEEHVLRGGEGARPAQRRHAAAGVTPKDAGARLVAPLAYGKSGRGAIKLVFQSVDKDVDDAILRHVDGLEVRIVTVVDRLTARQAGRDLPWQTIPRLRTPFEWRVPPGRYYAQCQVPGTDRERGVEIKIDADRPEVEVHLPTPRPGGLLAKPQ
jgi:hypothetical protein